ncbi:MAG TPA: type II secretion system protein GspC [Anaeromyxobacteraceae bacterium]|nr:type II secretion system protein GspC [Anaeromyxobacteraceae bacterium]
MAHWLLEHPWANPLMLDLFFKKYVWIAYAALIFAAAWLTARTVNTVIGAVIRPRPTVDLSARPASSNPAAVAAGPRLPPERLYALIGATPPAPPPSVAEAAEPARPRNCEDPRAIPTRTNLRAQLVGAVMAERPRNSIVSVTDLTSRETRIYGVGDVIQGARLIDVGRLRDDRDATGSGFRMAAIVCNDGQKEFIDFETGGAPAAVASVPSLGRAPVPSPAGGPAAGAATGEGVKKTAENAYEVPRNVVDGALSNMSALATQARIVPSFKNGVANGFKLFSIQPNSLYANIGVENGDVIQRINGYEINSPDKALEVYQKLRESSHITIELERNGRVIRKEYNVTGP